MTQTHTQDDIADLEATIVFAEDFANSLPKKERHILRSMLRVKPAARQAIEDAKLDEVKAVLRRVMEMGGRA